MGKFSKNLFKKLVKIFESNLCAEIFKISKAEKMKNDDFTKNLYNAGFSGKILFDVPMSQKTTMKVGGKAKIFLIPDCEKAFVTAICESKFFWGGFFVLGGGSNIIVSDEGLNFPVISSAKLKKIKFLKNQDLQIEQNMTRNFFVECGAGISWNMLCKKLCAKNFLALQDFNGLPGTIGGAVFMNARCFDSSVDKFLVSAKFLNVETQKIEEYKKIDSDWDYKKSPFNCGKIFLQKKIILSVRFKIEKSDLPKNKIEEIYKLAVQKRLEKKHFANPSAGSVFKNNHNFGMPSGKIIGELCALKGFSIGGAKIAPWHGNFIINSGGATSNEIKSLVQKIKSIVKEKTGFELEEEIIFV